MSRTCLSIVLAAGEGTRMKSSLPKVLHKIAGLPLICHVIKTMQLIGNDDIAVVVGHGSEQVVKVVSSFAPHAMLFEQKERLGTANAVLAARQALEKPIDDVLIVFGDTPLIQEHSLSLARQYLAKGADLIVMGFYSQNPTGYGRLIEENGKLKAIIEEKEANAEQKKINFCNGGLMAVAGKHLLSLLDEVNNNNIKGEYYLTDIVESASKRGLIVQALEVPVEDIIGINTRLELSEAEAIWQQRKRREMMLAGVTLVEPETVYFSYDTGVESDVVIEPHVFFAPGVKIESHAVIHGFSHIEGAHIGRGAEIGPFARLRPGAELGENVKVGNFCEIKKSLIHEGTKVNHLTYIGDAEIGARSNIGAGVITCNYDGHNKWKTIIGSGAFIGSNSALVAPVTIGNDSYIASGSVITKDVPDNAVAFGRAHQINKEGRAELLRARRETHKKN